MRDNPEIMRIQQRQISLGWSGVLIATAFMMLASSLILYPKTTNENILTALRLSSVTTAIPFLLVFIAKPLTVMASDLGRWVQSNRCYLWIILTISHLIHLYQILLYYQLGQSCPLIVWALTSPLWIIMVLFSGLELSKPNFFQQIFQARQTKVQTLLHGIGVWYIWLVFTLAFGLGAIARHLPFYNVPAFALFIAGAIMHGIVGWRRLRSRLS